MIEKQKEKQIKAVENRVKKKFRQRSKINCFFAFKRFSKRKSYIGIKQNFRNENYKI